MRALFSSTKSGLGTLVALTLITGEAQAESRFETSASSNSKAAAHLDFTIIIPEVVYLGSAGTAKDRKTLAQLTIEAGDRETHDRPYVVMTNGGTLAFAQSTNARVYSSRVTSNRGTSEAQPIRAYVVAMP